MTFPRSLISLALLVPVTALLVACGGGLELPATPTATRVPVLAPDAPAAPSTTGAAEVPAQPPTEAPPPAEPTQTPGQAVLQPLDTPTETPPEDTATPEPSATPPPLPSFEFTPGELVQGGTAIVYFNEAATAATMTFGGMQYPMLFDGARWWAIVGVGAFAETGTAPITVAYNPADGSAQTQVQGAIEIVDRAYEVENIDLDPSTSALLDPAIVNNEEALRATIFSGYTTQRLWDGDFQAPSVSPVSSTYGIARSYNGGPVSGYHRGTDFAGGTGEPVYAAAGGRVVFADALQVRGNSVIIDHGVGVFTTYSHLSAINVAQGEMVSAGQLLGAIGSTGLVTGPHLHWEVVVRGIEVDGELWLAGAVGQ